MYCRKCGNKLDITDTFCSKCGVKIEKEVYVEDIPNTHENSRNAIKPDLQIKETKFDRFIKKTFFANKDLSNDELVKTSKVGIVLVVLYQFVAMFLLMCFDVEIPTGAVYFIWWLIDCYILNQLGIRGVWKIWGLLVIPVYLCIRAKKTDKKYTWAIISILVFALAIGGVFASEFYGGTEVKYSNIDNDELETFYESERIYNWEVEGYIRAQQGEVESVDLSDYFPTVGQKYVYAQWIDESHSSAIYTAEIPYEYLDLIYFSGELVDENQESVTSMGYGYYEYTSEEKYVSKNYIKNILGEYSESVIMIQPGSFLQNEQGLSGIPHLFTVTTEAGTFKDCLAILGTVDDITGVYNQICFYAPKVGLVLTEYYDVIENRNKPALDDSVVFLELVEISNTVR